MLRPIRNDAEGSSVLRRAVCVATAGVAALSVSLAFAGSAAAQVTIPPVATLGAPGSALGAGLADVSSADAAWAAANGIDLVGTAAPASGVVSAGAASAGIGAAAGAGVVVGGLAAGYFIGSHATFAWNWYFGSSHTPDGDGPASGDLSWHAVSGPMPFVMGYGGIMGLGAVTVLSHPADGTPSIGGGFNEVQLQLNFDTGAHNGNLNTVFIHLTYVCQDSSGGTEAEGDVGNYTAAFEHPYQGNLTVSCGSSAFTPSQLHVWNVLGSGQVDSQGGVLAYNVIGSASVPALGPLRRVHAVGECQATDGTVSQIVLDSIDTFRETDAVKPAIPAITCVGSDRLISFTAVETSPGLTDVPLFSWTAPDAYVNLLTTYPACANQVCRLRLARLDPAGSGQWLDCFDNVGLCSRWFSDPTKTTDYQCTYGGSVVDLSECTAYAPSFDTDVPPAADGTTQATPYAPPDATTDPNPTSGAAPSTGCPPPINFGLSLFNPWWYYHSGQCLLQWAFVPDQATLSGDFNKVNNAWAASGPGEVAGYAGGFMGPVTSLSSSGVADCQGLDLNIPEAYIIHWHPFATCDGLAKWVNDFYMPIITGLVYFGGFTAGAKLLLSAMSIRLPFRDGWRDE